LGEGKGKGKEGKKGGKGTAPIFWPLEPPLRRTFVRLSVYSAYVYVPAALFCGPWVLVRPYHTLPYQLHERAYFCDPRVCICMQKRTINGAQHSDIAGPQNEAKIGRQRIRILPDLLPTLLNSMCCHVASLRTGLTLMIYWAGRWPPFRSFDNPQTNLV